MKLKCLALIAACVASGTPQAQIRGIVSWQATARILGSTAQQAILTYSAPSGEEGQPCVIEVSPSSTYAPLVPDVNPALFPGANLDNRPGASSNGRVRIVIIGKRTVETASDGNPYSRSLAASTTYYYRITCPSQTGAAITTGAFATGVIPSGMGYGDPIPADSNNPGSYLYPTLSATDRTATTVDPHTGALVKNMALPLDVVTSTTTATASSGSTILTTAASLSSGNIGGQIVGSGIAPWTTVTAISGTTVTISKPTTAALSNTTVNVGIIPTMGSSGNSQYCHPALVTTSDGEQGYQCLVMISGVAPGLYWINPSTGETRFLGVVSANYVSGKWSDVSWAWGVNAPFMDITGDPNTFYFAQSGAFGSAANVTYIIQGIYTGHKTRGDDADQTQWRTYNMNGMVNNAGHSVMTYSALTPAGRDITTLVSEFDPNWTSYGTTCCLGSTGWGADFNNGHIRLRTFHGQDTPGWAVEFDPKATASTQTATFGSTAGCIDNPEGSGWQSSYAGMPGCIVASTGTFTGGNGSVFRWSTLHGVLGGVADSPYQIFTLNPLRAEGLSPYQVELPAGMPASGSPCTMAQPQGSYVSNWPNPSWRPGCSIITVTGDPTNSSPPTGLPGSIPAAPGDLLTINSSGPTAHENLRLLDTGVDGKTWYVQRQYTRGLSSYDSVASNGTLDLFSPGGYAVEVWWDYTNGPKSTDYSNTYIDPVYLGHGAALNNANYGHYVLGNSWALNGVYGYGIQNGPDPQRFANPSAYPVVVALQPRFNGVACNGNSTTPCSVEQHPSLSILNPPDAITYAQLVDNYPYTGDYNFVTASKVTQIAGQLYRIRGLNVLARYKLLAFFANSGNYAMREVSGPSVQLATDSSTAYEWCVAYNSGECYNGSAPGDVYFNAPNVANAYCTNDWSPLQVSTTMPNDICVSQSWNWTQGIIMQQLVSDPNGATLRTISNSLGKYDSQLNFWNSRATPDGSWLFTTVADGSIKLFRVPPQVRDAVDRSAYVPVRIALPAAANADGAVVEFGYAEQGEGRFYCTTRQETCVAAAAVINPANPFYFEGEAYAPVPCASGCSIPVPGISGRILEYRLKLFQGSALVYTSPAMVAAVP